MLLTRAASRPCSWPSKEVGKPYTFCLSQECRNAESNILGSLVYYQASLEFNSKRCSLFFSFFQRATLLSIEVGAGDVCCRQQDNASRHSMVQTRLVL